MKGRVLLETASDYLRSLAASVVNGGAVGDAKYFCMFAGYRRSGHSLIGSFLDAHPRMVVAHELGVLRYVRAGFSAAQIYQLILRNARLEAKRGRGSTGYQYIVKGQWQGKYERIEVIGDKQGGQTTVELENHPEILDALNKRIPLPIKWVHITRNPFDNLTAISLRSRIPVEEALDNYFRKCAAIQKLKASVAPDRFIEMTHESFIEDTKGQVAKLCAFFDQAAPDDYLEACSGLAYKSPHKTRHKIEWTPAMIEKVGESMKPFRFLDGYSFES